MDKKSRFEMIFHTLAEAKHTERRGEFGEILLLTDQDFYQSAVTGSESLRGGNSVLYRYKVVIRLSDDGSHRVIKDVKSLAPWEIKDVISNFQMGEYRESHDNRLLLMLLPQ
jgi:hypothetical protein